MTIKTPNQIEEQLNFNMVVEPSLIIDQVAQYYEMDRKDLVSSKTRQKQQVANARQVCQYIIRRKTNLTLKQIAVIFDRKHTTIINSIKRVEEQLSNKMDNKVRNDVNKLNGIINFN